MQDIKDYLFYDPETGVFTRIKRFGKSTKITDSVVGNKHSSGYIQMGYKNKLYKAHRLAWWFVYGTMPDCAIDHINGIKSDNRICNLRLVTQIQNSQNSNVISTRNKSGYRGVSWNTAMGKWLATIQVKGKSIYLGSYDKPEEAHAAYLCAKKEHHPFWVEKETI